ncbi:hypothetical protein BLOT_005912 [Blomia tropicalis]|nr:hypothetical protein BLOT_005912 [Blomia tropicalis]
MATMLKRPNERYEKESPQMKSRLRSIDNYRNASNMIQTETKVSRRTKRNDDDDDEDENKNEKEKGKRSKKAKIGAMEEAKLANLKA